MDLNKPINHKNKNMKNIITLLILFFLKTNLSAQLSVQVVIPNLPSRVSELFEQSDKIQIMVTNTSATVQKFRVSGKVSIDNAPIANVLPSQSPVETVEPGQTRTYNLNDLAVFQNSIDYQSPVVIDILRSGYMPAGYLNWCFTLHDADNPTNLLSQEQCRGNRMTTYQSPVALYPDNKAILEQAGINMFRWSSVSPAFPGILNYELLVYEVQPGQDAVQALRSNQPVWTARTPATQLNWPFEVPREPGNYVWIVRALDSDDKSVGSSETTTEPRIFSIPSSQSGKMVNQQTRIPELPFIQMQIKTKGASTVIKNLIFPSNNLEAVQNLFDNSDQSARYEISLIQVPLVSNVNGDKAMPVFNALGDLITVTNADGPVLSFKNNISNAQWVGTKSGPMFIWRNSGIATGKEQVNLALDRVRRLADACKGLQSFLTF